VKLELAPVQQTRPYTCVAACLCTVFAALGTHHPEDDVARACNTDPSGATLPDAATAARSFWFNALFLPDATFELLTEWLQQGVPMIVMIAADDLAHGATGSHAVVVCGIEYGQVIVMDPAIGVERHLELETFLRAWRRRNNRGLVVLR